MLRAATRLLLADCRERWLAEWDGELHVLPDRRTRWAFTVDVLLGLPYIAVLTRHPTSRGGE